MVESSRSLVRPHCDRGMCRDASSGLATHTTLPIYSLCVTAWSCCRTFRHLFRVLEYEVELYVRLLPYNLCPAVYSYFCYHYLSVAFEDFIAIVRHMGVGVGIDTRTLRLEVPCGRAYDGLACKGIVFPFLLVRRCCRTPFFLMSKRLHDAARLVTHPPFLRRFATGPPGTSSPPIYSSFSLAVNIMRGRTLEDLEVGRLACVGLPLGEQGKSTCLGLPRAREYTVCFVSALFSMHCIQNVVVHLERERLDQQPLALANLTRERGS